MKFFSSEYLTMMKESVTDIQFTVIKTQATLRASHELMAEIEQVLAGQLAPRPRAPDLVTTSLKWLNLNP